MEFTGNLEIKHLKLLHKIKNIYELEVFAKDDRWIIEVTYYEPPTDELQRKYLHLKAGGVKKFSKLDDVAKLIGEFGFGAFTVNL